MRPIWTGSLRWLVGIFCAVLGALMLVAPHNFTTAAWLQFQPYFPLLGIAYMLAGAGLVVTAALSVARWAYVVAHLLAGTVLLAPAASFASCGEVPGLLNYAVVGTGTIVAAFLSRSRAGRPSGRSVDLFSFVMAMGAALTGVTMLVLPGAYDLPLFEFVRPHLPWYGALWLGAGLALIYAHVGANLSSKAFVAAHLLVAAAYASLVLTVMLPHGLATGTLYFGGFGVALALLPWLGPWMGRADSSSLRIRLAVILASAVGVPIVLIVTLATAQEQRLVASNDLAVQRAYATGLAKSVADYVRLHRASADALAAYPGLTGMTPAQQTALLESFAGAYSETLAYATYDDVGHPLARSDGLPLIPGDRLPVFESVRRTSVGQIAVGISPLTGREELAIAAPIYAPPGEFAGVVVVTLATSRLAELLSHAPLSSDRRVYLVDDVGDVVTYYGELGKASLADLAKLPPAAALHGSNAPSGSVAYTLSSGEWLSAYARVPGVGWAVVIEEPARSALANVNAERNLAFGLLLVAVCLAGIFGVVAGGGLARPLVTLADAIGHYTQTGGETPLPRSTTSEVARLATSFGKMRDRITARTEERARAEEALRRETALVRLLQDVAIAANEARSAEEACRAVLDQICRLVRWPVGHAWLSLLGAADGSPRSTDIWYLDDPHRWREFRQATEAIRFERGVGLTGRVAESGRPVWIRDATTDPNFRRAAAAATTGLRAAFAFPVKTGAAVAGVLEFFSTEAQDPDTAFMETIAIAGDQVGRVLERERRDREAAMLNELAELLQASLTVDEAYSVITRFGQRFFPDAAGGLFVMSPSKDLLEPACAWGPPHPVAESFKPEECWALRRGQRHLSNAQSGMICHHLGDRPRGASLCVPMVAQSEALGVLNLQWSAHSGQEADQAQIREDRQLLAVTLAKQIGPAIASLRLRETLREQSIRDPLTGLFNRRYMEESLEREVHRATRRSSGMAVMMLDLDHFKRFNDAHGHDAGDAMLSAFGNFLLSHTRSEDIACRYGGEEFVVIMADVSRDAALERAELIRQATSHLTVLHRGQALGAITLSVGVAVFPDHGATGAALLHAADTALYHAKQSGRARVEFAV